MKKNNESFTGGKYDTSEVSRRLYRGALDAARRLEEFLRSASNPDVLGADVTTLRIRLKDYCERLLFSDSQDFSRKAEELLWRKVYYEPLQMYKQKRKKASNGGTLEGSDLLCGWLRSGVGHYQHLILRIQSEFQLPPNSILTPHSPWRHRGLRKERWSRHQRSVCVRGREDWATQTAHRCLMCLGDLSRYLSECGDPGSDYLSESYYRQAFLLMPSLGMPFNQMGTLSALDQDKSCHALYFYLRCLLSPQSFEGADGNIQRVFEKNQPLYEAIANKSESDDKELLHPVLTRLCVRFLKLAELFFKQQESILSSLCQEVLQDLDMFLSFFDVPFKQGSTNSGDTVSTGDQEMEDGQPELLTFRLGIIALMSFARLQSQGSPLVSAAAAFVLSFLTQVVRHCLIHLQAAFFVDSNETSPGTTILPPPNNSLTVNGPVLPEKETSWSPGIEEDGTRTRSTSGTLTPIAAANGALSDETVSQTTKNKSELVESRLANSLSGHHKRHASLLSHLRRRRCRNTSSTSQDDSEVSNEEGDFCESDAENGITSDISETGSVHGSDGSLTEQDEEEDEEEVGNELTISLSDNPPPAAQDGEEQIISESDKDSSDAINSHQPDHQLKWWETLDVLQRESFLLALVKVLSHWLTCHPDILSACAQSTHSLWKHFADLLNLLAKAESSLLNTEEFLSSRLSQLKCPRPLSSDISNNISNNQESVVNNNNNNHDNSYAESEVLRAVQSWSWYEMLPEDIELQQLPFLVSQRITPANQNNSGNLKKEFQSINRQSNEAHLVHVSPQQAKKCKQAFGRIQGLLHFGLVHSFPNQPVKIQNQVNYFRKNGCMKTPKVDIQDPLFSYDPVKKSFTVYEPSQNEQSNEIKSPVQNKSNKNNNNYENASSIEQDPVSGLDGQRKQLMRNMAHLWLKAEVQDLEGRTGSTRGGKSGNHSGPGHRHNHYIPGGRQGGLQGGCLPPYLVPDTGALCHQLPSLKQLLSARRFIIILPSCVISSLDELKRQSAYAREAIRWIEAELRAGSRFLRPQKTQERMSLMPMKYPKRKEKEAWDFFQVLECCNFLNKNHSQGRATSAPLVTLVTGGNQFLPPNAAAVASSAGVSMESVEDFLNKWRNSLKS